MHKYVDPESTLLVSPLPNVELLLAPVSLLLPDVELLVAFEIFL